MLFGSSRIGDDAVGLYGRDTASGALTLVDSEVDTPGLESPLSIAVSPEGTHAYVAAGGGDSVGVFDIRCGGGTLDAGELCDDGNNLRGDGCHDFCGVEQCWVCGGEPSVCTPDDGTLCDDGNLCTTGDTCGAGDCVGLPDDGVTCNDRDVCTVNDTCLGGACNGAAELEVDCRQSTVPGGSRFSIKVPASDLSRDQVAWKWTKGQATTVADFGDPLTLTHYTACVYDQLGTPQPAIRQGEDRFHRGQPVPRRGRDVADVEPRHHAVESLAPRRAERRRHRRHLLGGRLQRLAPQRRPRIQGGERLRDVATW